MSKILKNTTGSNIELISIGLTVPANSQIIVDQTDYDLVATSDSLLEIAPLLISGDIIINDGVSDLSGSNGLSLLQGNLTTITDNLIDNDRIKVDIGAALVEGPQGPQGDPGQSGFGVYAFANVSSSGTISKGRGISVVKTGTGTYQYTFSTPTPDSDYIVSAGFENLGTNTDTNWFVDSKTINGFILTTGIGDNSTTVDTLADTNHNVTILGDAGPQGITSAYESWLNVGNTGSEQDFLNSLKIDSLKISSNDQSTSSFLESKFISSNNKLDISVANEGANEQIELTVNAANISISELNDDSNFLDETAHDSLPQDNPHNVTKTQVGLSNVDNTSDANKPISTATQTALDLKYDASNPNGYETPAQLNSRDTDNRSRANHTGTQLSSTISDFNVSVVGAQTVTAIQKIGNIIRYTDESGSDTDIDLSIYIDDTNLARIVSGVLDSGTGIVTFTRDDVSTFTVDFSNIIPNISVQNKIQVSKNGNDTTGDGSLGKPYLTINQALTYINTQTPSITNQFYIEVGPGSFIENPITIPEYVLLSGSSSRTTVIAANPNADLINVTQNTTIRDIVLYGVSNSANYLIKAQGTASGLVGIISVILSTSANGICSTSSSGILSTIINECISNGITGDCIVSKSGANITLDSGYFIGNGTTTVALVQDGGDLTIFSGKTEYCLSSIDVRSNTGKVNIYSIDNAEGTIPLRQTGTADIFVNGGRVDLSKAQIIETSVIEGFVYSEIQGEKTVNILSELSVGIPGKGRETCLGEGDSYTNGMLVYSYNGTFTNITTSTISADGSTFTFDSTAVNDAIYLATALPEEVTGNRFPFFGLKVNTLTASVGGEIAAEYWDGSSWIELNHMSTDSSGTYLPHKKEIFQRTGFEHVRFDYTIEDDWQTSDPVTLGLPLYWMRFRIVSTLTTAPVFEQFKVHSNRTEINKDGYIEYFGTGRPINILPFDSGTFQAANASPNNQDLWIGDNLGVGRIENQFDAFTTDRVGLVRPLPLDLDTSCPMKVILHLHSELTDVSPDIDFTIRYSTSNQGSSVYDATNLAPTTAVGQKTVTGSVANPGQDLQFIIEFNLDISDFTTRNSSNIGDLLWLTIQRDNDGNTSDISLIQVEIQYTKWCNGGHQ